MASEFTKGDVVTVSFTVDRQTPYVIWDDAGNMWWKDRLDKCEVTVHKPDYCESPVSNE